MLTTQNLNTWYSGLMHFLNLINLDLHVICNLIYIFQIRRAEIKKLNILSYILIIFLVLTTSLSITTFALSISKDVEKSLESNITALALSIFKDVENSLESNMPDNVNKQATTSVCSNRPCFNQGICLNTMDIQQGFICICPPSYFGNICEHGK